MAGSLWQMLLAIGCGILVILLLTLRAGIHAFFALLAACLVTGLALGLDPLTITGLIQDGFGNMMKSLSLIIVLGTTLGLVLEQNGSTRVIADSLLALLGRKMPALALSVTGFLAGLPIFCDSGYIVLCGLNPELSRRTGVPVIFLAGALATGLLSVHCLLPPHPGATAAAAELGVDYGRMIVYGLLIAVPAMVTGYIWVRHASRRLGSESVAEPDASPVESGPGPSLLQALLPILVPIVLISLRSVWLIEKGPQSLTGRFFLAWGNPVLALTSGILLACLPRNRQKKWLAPLLRESVEKGGSILMIIGAGGAFGAVITAARPGELLGSLPALKSLGILFPFLLALFLKTAQGSSTVAIITAASIIKPMLPMLALQDENGRLLAVLSLGAGSMIISHANDAYFWVISRFSAIDMKTMLRVYSLATLWMGLVSLACIYLLSIFLS